MASVTKRRWTSPKGEAKEGWEVRYFDALGKRRSKTFRLKKDADGYARKVANELEVGAHVAPRASPTLKEAEREYLNALDTRRREGTYRDTSYRKEESHLRIHVVPELGGRRLAELTDIDAHDFFTRLRRKGLAAESTAAIFATLGRLLDYAKRRRWVSANVAREVRTWPENRLPTDDKVRTFDIDEARRLQAYLVDPCAVNSTWRPRYAAMARCIVYLGLFAGLRSGEIRGLPWAAVDFEGGTVEIRQQIDEFRKIVPPKTRSSARIVPLPRMVMAELAAWQAMAVANDDGLIFTTKQGRGLSAQDLHNHIWKRILTDLGYSGDQPGGWPHFHALRHFAATIMQQHMPVGDVSPLLGHKNTSITLSVYTGRSLTAQHRRVAIEDMATAFAPAA